MTDTIEELSSEATLRAFGFGILLTIACVPATYAGLLFEGVAAASGGGFGASNTVLVVQNNGTERGCVAWNGAADYIGSPACVTTVAPSGGGVSSSPGGNEIVLQTRTRTIAETGAFNANQIRVVFNAVEGVWTSAPIQIDDLVINFFDPNGNLVWSSSQSAAQPAWAPVIYNDPSGTGSFGQVFRLYFEDSPTVQALVFNQPNFLNYRVGVQLAATQANGGADSVFAGNAAALGFAETPEPIAFSCLALGLAAIFAGKAYRDRRHPKP